MQQFDFKFTRDKEDAQIVEQYLNPLPRTVTRSGAHELLDGEWRFEIDLEDRGISEKWHLQHEFKGTANWPGSVESHMAEARDAQQLTPQWQDQVIAWYEREFVLPEKWYKYCDCLTQVTFGACGYETRVWLNGHALSTIEGDEVHYGEYTSFSYDLPPEYLQPINKLTVRIADSLDSEIPRGKQQSTVYKKGGIWYQTYTGAARSIWLEPVERNRLRSRLNVLSSFRDRFVAFDLTIRIHDPGAYKLRLVITERCNENPLVIREFDLPLEAGNTCQRVTVEFPEVKYWSPAHPHLYTLVAQLMGNSEEVSQIETHFGIRHIEARGRTIYLNNKPTYLDGILYQPGTATFEQIRKHMLEMKRLGCNLVRVHISGIDPRCYDLADELGLLLWVEVPSPHSSTARSRENHWAELQRMLVFAGSHPSIVIWSLYNEDWGVQDIATSAETRNYIIRAYSYMKLVCPQTLIVDNDGWHHVSLQGRLNSDLFTAHLYTPDLGTWKEMLDKLVVGQNEGVAVNPLTVGDPFFNVGQIPLVVSEWGGFGFVDYGGPEEEAAKAERIVAFKRELRARPIAGDVYTQAVSIEDETNGLIDPHTSELLVPQSILNSN
jgi:beta-galactosidase/beta-glucuronidase